MARESRGTPFCQHDLMILFTNPSARVGYDTWSIFKRSLTGFNSECSFSYTSCLTKAEEPSPSYYLPIAGGRIIGFIPFSRVLVLCEMKLFSSRIWTRVTVFISYDDNHYTTVTLMMKMTTYIHIHTNIYECMHKHLYTHMSMYICISRHPLQYMHACISAYMRAYINIHTYMHT